MSGSGSSSAPLHFTLAWNSGQNHHTILLFGFKRIISQQLPMMPVDYIIRILLDRYHRCILAIQLPEQSDDMSPEQILEHSQVVGGICFRPFHPQGFAEIVFLAVEESNKHRGIGTKVMNQLKEHVKTENIKFFLTYADNTAIGYFVKQGFTKKKSMVRSRWDGFIKDYVRSTLMECKILYNVNYITFKKDLALQKEAILKKIRSMSKSHIVRGPLDFGKKGSINIEDIPGVLEAGWKKEDQTTDRVWNIDNSLTAQMGRILKVSFKTLEY
jgi:histone acetyltransferase